MSQASPTPLFNPAPAAVIQWPWNIALLSQRDTHLQIPINFVTQPGISLRAACFAHNIYEYNAFSQCLSNLLSAGLRRYTLDLYWDQRRQAWNLCPAEVPTPDTTPMSLTLPVPTPSSTTRNSPSGRLPALSLQTTALMENMEEPQRRQIVETISNPTATFGPVFTVTIDPLLSTTASTRSSLTSAGGPSEGETMYTIGPYTCSSNVDILLVIQLLQSYLTKTDNTLEAAIQYLTLNLHVAAPYNDPVGSAQAPDRTRLPQGPDLPGALFNANLSAWLYTPTLLAQQRSYLPSSWFQVDNTSTPDVSYFRLASATSSTPDGWPSESWVEFEKGERLLLGFGEIDVQLAGYNASADAAYVFPPSYLMDTVLVSYTFATPTPASCIFNASSPQLRYANSSFVVSADFPEDAFTSSSRLHNINMTIPSVSNLTSCGISPFLNETLLNSTADVDPVPYMSFALSSVWSWAPGEPLDDDAVAINATSDNSNDNGDSQHFRCAFQGARSQGRWHVGFCSSTYRGACRQMNESYAWALTEASHTYYELESQCPTNHTFAVPRTALENRYLLQAVERAGEQRVFINFNSLATEHCWVSGVHSSCPYVANTSNDAQVIVPTVAAILVFVISLGLLLVKCGGNRKDSRRSRRQKTYYGWDYEGVPS